jgi:hypothetical protein
MSTQQAHGGFTWLGHGSSDTRKAWLMVPYFAAAFVLTSVAGVWALDLLGLGEGDLFLMAGNVAGWATEIAFALVLVAPAALGVVYAVRALRRGWHWAAGTALGVNAVLVGFVVYMFVDAVRMTYWPGG